MSLATAGSAAVHVLFAGLWTGSVLFVTFAILPLARDGSLNAAPLSAIAGKLTSVSRVSAVLMLFTGGHMAAARYSVDSLTGSTRGHLVIGMVVLWLVLAALVEIGAARLDDGTEADKVREPAREATRIFQAAAVVALLLLLDAGALAGGLGA